MIFAALACAVALSGPADAASVQKSQMLVQSQQKPVLRQRAASGSATALHRKTQVQQIKTATEGVKRRQEAKDKLGNVAVQRLMSDRNQAETLSSNVQKKLDQSRPCPKCL